MGYSMYNTIPQRRSKIQAPKRKAISRPQTSDDLEYFFHYIVLHFLQKNAPS